MKTITENDIIQGAEFNTKSGIIKIIEVIPNYVDDLTCVKTTFDGTGDSLGAPFSDEINELIQFINHSIV